MRRRGRISLSTYLEEIERNSEKELSLEKETKR